MQELDWFERTLLHIVEHLPLLQTDTEGSSFVGDAENVGYDVGLSFVESNEVAENPLELLVDIFIGFCLSRCRTIEDIVYAVGVVCSGTVFRGAAAEGYIRWCWIDIG